jgi:hypothetical protein
MMNGGGMTCIAFDRASSCSQSAADASALATSLMSHRSA